MFTFLFGKKQDTEPTNTLESMKDKTATQVIDDFIKLTQTMTKSREALFTKLHNFVLESDQWKTTDLKKLDDENYTPLVFNFSEEYLERYLARLFPRNPHTGVLEVGVKVRAGNETDEKRFEKEILEIYKQEKLADKILEQSKDFLVGGASCFFYPQDPITKRAIIRSLDPRKCFLGWKDGELVQFAYAEYLGKNNYLYTYYDKQNIIVKNEYDKTVTRTDNPFAFIPVSWIPNNPKPHSQEGIPKTILLSKLDQNYNKNASNFDKRVEDNTEPHLVIKSDMVDSEKIQRGRNKKSKIGSNDDMYYLELKDGVEIQKWLELLEKRIVQKTGLIYSAGNVSKNVSGESLSFQFSDMMDLIGFMRLKWDNFFRELNSAILTYKYGENIHNTDPVYQPFMAQDNNSRIDQYVKLITNNLITHKDAIDELRGVENAEQQLEEILAEIKLFSEQRTTEQDNKLINKEKQKNG